MESVIELIWGFPKIRATPIAGWFIVENAIKMDDDWGYTPMTMETAILQVAGG